MQNEAFFAFICHAIPVMTRRFQQLIGADNIGFDEGDRSIDRAVNMTFCRQMHNAIRLIVCHDAIQLSAMANIHLFEGETCILLHRRQRRQIAGIA